MNGRKIIIISILTLFLIILSGCDRWSPRRDFGGRHPPCPQDFEEKARYRVEKMADDLGLSEEQMDSLVKIQKQIMKKHIEIHKEEKKKEIELKSRIVEMVEQDSLSEDEVLNFMKELHSVKERYRTELDTFVARKITRAHSILTEEQRKKMAEKLEKFERRRINK